MLSVGGFSPPETASARWCIRFHAGRRVRRGRRARRGGRRRGIERRDRRDSRYRRLRLACLWGAARNAVTGGSGAARGAWLLFLRPGTVLEASWGEEAPRFATDAERRGSVEAAAVFRAQPLSGRSFAAQALALFGEALRRTPDPGQGLIISREFYDFVGGHQLEAGDPEADLLRRIGRGRLVRLRSAIMPFDAD